MSAQPADALELVHFRSGAYLLAGRLRVHDETAPTIVLLHGLGFHAFEYDALAPLLTQSGFNTLAFDHRCHGHSEGPRGRWVLGDLIEDGRSAIEFLAQRLRGPIGIFGNSMGAIVGLGMAVGDVRVRSLAASSCPTRVADFAATSFRMLLLQLMRAIALLAPLRISVNHFIPYRRILLNKEIIARVRGDPLITDARRFAPSTYVDIMSWNALPLATRLAVPLLVLYALHDGLQPPEQSTMLFDSAKCEKEIQALDTGHVPDLENPDLLSPVLADWFKRTLVPRASAKAHILSNSMGDE